jgi:hypothetical protein
MRAVGSILCNLPKEMCALCFSIESKHALLIRLRATPTMSLAVDGKGVQVGRE